MRTVALLVIIFGSIPFILRWPYVGVLMWSWVSYMNPHRFTWGATQEFPVAFVVAVTTIIAWLVSRESKRIPLNPITVLLFMFAFWTSVTTLFAYLPQDGYEGWKVFMKILLMSFIALPLINTRQRLNALIWVTVGSIGFFGVKGGIFALLTGGEYKVYGPPGSSIEANNGLALALIMIIPLMRFLQLDTPSRWVRWGLSAAMVLCGFSVVFSYSRGAFVAGAVMLFFMMLKSRKRVILGIALVMAVLIGASLAPEKWFDRIATIETYQQDGSVQGRFQAWRFAFKLALDHPIVGGGFNVTNSGTLYNSYVPGVKPRNFHSIYFQVLGEHGFVGLTLFLMIGIAGLRTATNLIRRTRGRPELAWAQNLAAMVQVAMIGYATGGLFVNKAYFDLYYGLLIILVIAKLLAVQTLQAGAVKTQRTPSAAFSPVVRSAPPAPRMPPH